MQLRRSTGIPFPVSIPSLIIHSREDYVGTRSSNGHEYELLRNITTHSNKGPVSQNNSAFPTHYYAVSSIHSVMHLFSGLLYLESISPVTFAMKNRVDEG